MPTLKLINNFLNLPVIEVTVTGRKFRLLIDTGASNSVFSESFVKALKHLNQPKYLNPIGHQDADTIGGKAKSIILPIRFQFCGVYINDITVNQNVVNQIVHFDGLIGQDILQQFSTVTFNNRDKTVKLEL